MEQFQLMVCQQSPCQLLVKIGWLLLTQASTAIWNYLNLYEDCMGALERKNKGLLNEVSGYEALS